MILECVISFIINLLVVLLVQQVLLDQVNLDHRAVQPYQAHLLLLLVHVVLMYHLHRVFPVLLPYHLDRFDPSHLGVLELLGIPSKNLFSYSP